MPDASMSANQNKNTFLGMHDRKQRNDDPRQSMARGWEGMIVANAFTDPRSKVKSPPRSRRRCHCGCGRRATHMGQANGVTMIMGCELSIARWVKSPIEHRKSEARAAIAKAKGDV